MVKILKEILEEVYNLQEKHEGYFDLTYEFNTDGILHVKVYVDTPKNFSTYFEKDIDNDFMLDDFISEIENFLNN